MSALDEYADELSAFADDDEAVLLESDGSFVLQRGGEVISGRLHENADGHVIVQAGGEEIPYRKFLTHRVARLDLLAERLLAKKASDPSFVDGMARLDTATGEPLQGQSLELLRSQCEDASPWSTRVTFVTADAGHGKTVLLQELQAQQAEAFRAGRSNYLVWHVDLQGRQLVRLSEALMGDLAWLRVPGLWMSAVLRLMRRRAIILAIDGFDELAAEQGNTDALGALSVLVRDLDDRGVVIAASRRTFFDSDDYGSRSGLVSRHMTSSTEFNHLLLLPWSEHERRSFLTSLSERVGSSASPDAIYSELTSELGDDSHPMLTRPFLFSRVARGVIEDEIPPSEFLRGADDPLHGVAAVVEAFVNREVTHKWKSPDTGEAYLSFDQHMELLSAIAEEMYLSQRDRLSLDVIETHTALLMDEWGIELQRRQQVLMMVRMHVLLPPPPGGDQLFRSFDHHEFRDYFVAVALRDRLRMAAETSEGDDIARLLSIAQMSDSTARYVCAMLEIDDDFAARLASVLISQVRREWMPTYLQMNVGTLLPFVLSGRRFSSPLRLEGGAILSSLVLEGTQLANIELVGMTLLRASTERANWQSIKFIDCDLGELTVDESAHYEDVVFENCKLDGVRLVRSETGEEISREYAPARMARVLSGLDIGLGESYLQPQLDVDVADSQTMKVVRRFLRLFHRTTVVSTSEIEGRFRQDHHIVTDVVIPSLEALHLLEEREWRGAGTQRIWGIRCRIDDLLAAEGAIAGSSPMAEFWSQMRSA